MRLTAKGGTTKHTGAHNMHMNDGSRQAYETTVSLPRVLSRPLYGPGLLACVCAGEIPQSNSILHLVHCVPFPDHFHVIFHFLAPFRCTARLRRKGKIG